MSYRLSVKIVQTREEGWDVAEVHKLLNLIYINNIVDTDNRDNRLDDRTTTITREVPYPSDDSITGNTK